MEGEPRGLGSLTVGDSSDVAIVTANGSSTPVYVGSASNGKSVVMVGVLPYDSTDLRDDCF